MSALNVPPTLNLSTPKQLKPPPAAGVVGTAGVIAFLAGLSFLFGATLIAYAIVRSKTVIPMPALPWIFWFSTFATLLSSLFLWYSAQSARLMRPVASYRGLLMSTGLAYLFLGLQGPGMIMLAQMSMPFRAVSPTLYALTFILIGLHLVHVIGGVVAMSVFALRAERKHFDGTDIGQLRPVSIYQHYLAFVWVVMFSFLLVLN